MPNADSPEPEGCFTDGPRIGVPPESKPPEEGFGRGLHGHLIYGSLVTLLTTWRITTGPARAADGATAARTNTGRPWRDGDRRTDFAPQLGHRQRHQGMSLTSQLGGDVEIPTTPEDRALAPLGSSCLAELVAVLLKRRWQRIREATWRVAELVWIAIRSERYGHTGAVARPGRIVLDHAR